MCLVGFVMCEKRVDLNSTWSLQIVTSPGGVVWLMLSLDMGSNLFTSSMVTASSTGPGIDRL